jgi:hypothetical protein
VVVGNPARIVKHIRDLVCPATGENPYRHLLGADEDESETEPQIHADGRR